MQTHVLLMVEYQPASSKTNIFYTQSKFLGCLQLCSQRDKTFKLISAEVVVALSHACIHACYILINFFFLLLSLFFAIGSWTVLELNIDDMLRRQTGKDVYPHKLDKICIIVLTIRLCLFPVPRVYIIEDGAVVKTDRKWWLFLLRVDPCNFYSNFYFYNILKFLIMFISVQKRLRHFQLLCHYNKTFRRLFNSVFFIIT